MATITNNPTNQSELQLYRVLERANLLSYYDSFIQQGGDDVQQLCEASEDEFMEIMQLVGMSSKPLHVRRLQKALQEWVLNPEQFNVPLTSPPQQNLAIPLSLGLHSSGQGQQLANSRVSPQIAQSVTDAQSNNASSSSSSSPRWPNGPSLQQQDQAMLLMQMATAQMSSPTPVEGSSNSKMGLQQQNQVSLIDHAENPQLSMDSLSCIREAAEVIMAAEQPSTSPPPLNRKLVKELQHIFELTLDDPRRTAEIRKWSAIYGRFDSKRKSDKPLTLHEVTVNEAAAQLCQMDPFLMAQREKLFPMSRQVVRESGYRYKHGHSRKKSTHTVFYQQQGLLVSQDDFQKSLKVTPGKEDLLESAAKKPKLEPVPSYRDADGSPNPRTVQAELMRIRREERMNEITSLLNTIKQSQSNTKASIVAAKSCDNLQQVYDLQIELEKLTTQQLLLMTEQTDLIKKQRRSDRYYVAKARAKDENDEEGLEFLDGGSEAGKSDDNPDEMLAEANNIDASAMQETTTMETSSTTTTTTTIELATSVAATTTTTPKPQKKKSSNSTRVLLQNALMDEGLRIAQAYSNIEDPSLDDDRGSANLDGCQDDVDDETKPTGSDDLAITNGVENTDDNADSTGEAVTNGLINGGTVHDETNSQTMSPTMSQTTSQITSQTETELDTRTDTALLEAIVSCENTQPKSEHSTEQNEGNEQAVL